MSAGHGWRGQRSEPAAPVGGVVRESRSGSLLNGREPVGLSERAYGVVIGVCVVAAVALAGLAVALTWAGL